MIPTSTLHLRDLILAEARARGVPLEAHTLRLEHDLPVLRLRCGETILRGCTIRLPGEPGSGRYNPDVVTVHGSGFRASRMWPRKLDGSFNIKAITDHLLALVQQELSRPKAEVHVPVGVPAAASGLHVVHCAGVHLGVIGTGAKAEAILSHVEDEKVWERIAAHLGRGGLTDRDLRALGDAVQLSFGRAGKLDFDPFEPINDRTLTVLALGEPKGKRVERRYVLVLDHRGDEIVLADPAGMGVTTITPSKLNEAWRLGSRRGKPWVGFIGAK